MATDEKGEEIRASLPGDDIYAVFANRFHVIATEGFTRIVFGESPSGGQTFYRLAVALPTEDAKNLGEVLLDLIRKLNEDDAEDKASD
jgi:hypothetical protein